MRKADNSTQGAQKYVAYQSNIAKRHMLPLFRRLGVPLNRPVLDVGCGKGGCAIALAEELGVSVHGIDLLASDISIARKAAADAGAQTVTFEVLDIVNDPLPADRYALMLLRDVVEHLPD